MESQHCNLDGYPLSRAQRIMRQRKLPQWLWRSSGGVGGALIVLLAYIIVPGISGILPPKTHLLLIFCVYVAAYALLLLTQRRITALSKAASLMSGDLTLSFAEDGLTLTSDEETLFRKWSAVTDVISDRQGILLLDKGLTVLPVPAAAFASPSEMEAFTAALRARIPTVKESF